MIADFAESKYGDVSTSICANEEKGTPRSNCLNENKIHKRHIKWFTNAKSKTIIGFDNLSATDLPTMGVKPKGISVVLNKIIGWNIPFRQFGKNAFDNYKFNVQLSLSMYHFKSKTFFGSTWISSPISISPQNGGVPIAIDLDYNEILYLISKIIDPDAVGVVEIVVSKIDQTTNIILQQYGCGWTIIKLFESGCIDASDTSRVLADNDMVTKSSPILMGSPRDLVSYSDLRSLLNNCKRMPNCITEYKLFSHRQLLSIHHLISENQLIGRHDVIPGLIPKDIPSFNDLTNILSIPCLGDEEYIKSPSCIIVYPSIPQLSQTLILQVSSGVIYCESRHEMERRMAIHIAKQLGIESYYGNIQISSRTMKLGIHNGHTIISNEWISVPLTEDNQDENLLLMTENMIDISEFVPHDLTALVVALEYEFKIATNCSSSSFSSQLFPSQTLRRSFEHNQQTVTVCVGASAFVPYDGSRLVLNNHPNISTDQDKMNSLDNRDELAVQVDLKCDSTCSLLSNKPMYIDSNSINASQYALRSTQRTSASPKRSTIRVSDAKGTANMIAIPRRSGSSSLLSSSAVVKKETTPFTVAFDLKVFDSLNGKEFFHCDLVDMTTIHADHQHACNNDKQKSHTIRESKEDTEDNRPPIKPETEEVVDWSEIKLDPRHYTKQIDPDPSPTDSDSSSEVSCDTLFRLPMHKNCLLTRVAKLSLASSGTKTACNKDNNKLQDDHQNTMVRNQVHTKDPIDNHRPYIRVRAVALTESSPRAVRSADVIKMDRRNLMVSVTMCVLLLLKLSF